MASYALVLALLISSPAYAFTKGDLSDSVYNLRMQLRQLEKKGPVASCPEQHAKLNAEKDLRISLFYGYEDYEDLTADSLHATAMTKVLLSKCKGAVQACGFSLSKRDGFKVTLVKQINGRKVSINIHSTSVSEDNGANSNWGGNQWAQYAQSQLSWREFHRALRTSDIVFYSGHSRHGGGLGFNIQSFGQDTFNYLFRSPLRATLSALAERPSRLKLLGLISCTSNEYYRAEMMRANPNMDMLVSHADIDSEEGEQISIGALDALLRNKCEKDFKKALVADIDQQKGRMELVRAGQLPRGRTLPPRAPEPRSDSESAL